MALTKSVLLKKEDIAFWLCYARSYTSFSQTIAFANFTPWSPPNFFDDEFVSPITHLLYFCSKFLSYPLIKRPPLSPDHHLFTIGLALQQSTAYMNTLKTLIFLTILRGGGGLPLRHAHPACVPHGFALYCTSCCSGLYCVLDYKYDHTAAC